MSKIGFTDQQWAFIQPLLPPPAHTGRPRANDRRTIAGILYILITGCRWSPAVAGRTYHANMARRRRYGADSNTGASWASGNASGGRRWRHWIERVSWTGRSPSSTVPLCLPRTGAPALVSPAKAKEPSGCWWSMAMGCRWGFIWPAPIRRRYNWPSRLWRRFGSHGLVDVPDSGRRNWSPTVAMIAQRSVRLCGGGGWPCVFHPSVVPPPGVPSADAPLPHARSTQGRLSAALYCGAELRLAGNLSAITHSVGTALHGRPRLVHGCAATGLSASLGSSRCAAEPLGMEGSMWRRST
jgi:transposase